MRTRRSAVGHPGIVAPPAMIQVWTMMGLGGVRAADDPLTKILELFDDAGYIGVVATNCEQTYHRYLRPGEEVSVSAELTDVAGPKQTALGEGFFITQRITWQVGDEDVAEMNWRIMKFIPRETDGATQSSQRPGRPRRRLDDAAGVVEGHEVLLGRRQRARTAYPEAARRQPAASAGACHLAGQGRPPIDYAVASGKGTVFSFVVHHAPKVPGRTLPFVDRARRTRRGGAHARRASQCRPRRRGDRNARSRNIYRLSCQAMSGRHGRCTRGSPANTKSMSAPNRGRHEAARTDALRRPDVHRVDGDRHRATIRTSTTTATRRSPRVPRTSSSTSSTDTGLVQRYITDWAGPNAVIKSICLRLGVPWYAYDTVTFPGEVTAVEDGLITLKVVGSNSLGDHVIANPH